jgi:hypothetical protein
VEGIHNAPTHHQKWLSEELRCKNLRSTTEVEMETRLVKAREKK